MTNTATTYKSPLHQMTQTTCTCLWNDSSSPTELGYAIDHGAVGATCNPVIVVDVLKREMPLWRDRILELIRSMPTSPSVRPKNRLASPASADSPSTDDTATNASTVSAKYSAGPK